VANQVVTFGLSPLQQHLLVVALEDSPEVVADTWKEIRPQLALDELEPGLYELLPLVYRNLAECDLDEPELPRLKGIYRKAWVANALLVERTKETAEALTAVGVPALFIEGVALASRFYSELGLRPTTVVDVCVSERDEPAALAQLQHAGWAASEGAANATPRDRYLSERPFLPTSVAPLHRLRSPRRIRIEPTVLGEQRVALHGRRRRVRAWSNRDAVSRDRDQRSARSHSGRPLARGRENGAESRD
jgi:hypothetical protein